MLFIKQQLFSYISADNNCFFVSTTDVFISRQTMVKIYFTTYNDRFSVINRYQLFPLLFGEKYTTGVFGEKYMQQGGKLNFLWFGEKYETDESWIQWEVFEREMLVGI